MTPRPTTAEPAFPHVYIHIPFCVSKCPYCDFYSIASGASHARFLDALEAEFALRLPQTDPPRDLRTLFVGGGTPSVLNGAELDKLTRIVANHFRPADDCEWTFEANPESLDSEKLRHMVRAGATRISLGVQSLDPVVLATLGRAHTADQAREGMRLLARSGLPSWSVDLMFGVGGQTTISLAATLEAVLAFEPPHVSAYALTIEPGSEYARTSDPRGFCSSDDTTADQFGMLMDRLSSAGYEHYEVSNYAKEGHRCLHNQAYWSRAPYIGFGPSAHSFDGQSRWWNVRNVSEYEDRCLRGDLPTQESEWITPDEAIEETVFLSMRTREGLRWDSLGANRPEGVIERLRPLAEAGFLEMDEQGVRLAPKGFVLSDSLIRRVADVVCG